MKKLLLALPFVATASWAGTTLYSGSQTRAAYDDLVAQLDGASGMKVSTESYTSGFAASRAITQVRTSDAPDSTVLFRLHHDISHSPVGLGGDGARVGAARIVTTLLTDGLPDEVRPLLEGFDGAVPIVLESDVGFDRRVSNILSIAPYSLSADGIELEVGALRYDVDVDAAGGLAGAGTFDGARLAMTDEGVDITVTPGTDRFEMERIGKGLYAGEQHARIGTITVENAAMGMAATFDEVTLSSDSALVGERLESGVTLASGRIDSMLPLDSFSFGTRVGGIDVAGMETYLQEAWSIGLLDAESLDPDEMIDRLGRMYAGLISPGLSLDYDIALSNAGGDVTASAGIVFEGDGSASGYDAMTTVGELVRALKLSATLEADVDAVAMTPAAMFLADDRLAPWIVSDGVAYRSDLGVDDLIVDINGNPMSLEMMVGGMLEMPLDLSMLMSMADQGR